MNFDEKLFKRDVSHDLNRSLDLLIDKFKENGLDFNTSLLFSDFVLLSSKQNYSNRFSICQLGQIFNDNDLPTSEFLKIYMIAMLCIDPKDKREFIW